MPTSIRTTVTQIATTCPGKTFNTRILIKVSTVEKINDLAENAIDEFEIDEDDTSYFVFTDTIKNNAYRVGDGSIKILMKNGSIQDITTASDNSNLEALVRTVQKYILCYLKEVKLFD